MTIQQIFKKKNNILIGMIHLSPLLSISGFEGIKKTTEKALRDLLALQSAGFDGALIENENDKPHTEFANPAQIANFTVIAQEVCKHAKIPVGVQIMLNDWKSSFSIAKVVGAKFTRLDVFVDHVSSRWGEIHPNPRKIIKYKKEIFPELLLLTDIQVKYKTMIVSRSLIASARQAIAHESDGLIITGEATGKETPLSKIQEVRKAFPDFPIFVGAGIRKENIREQLSVANGAIVGTSIKTRGMIYVKKAKMLRRALNK
ncbi:MAG: BtpA/SgcQ family protein [Candidatus Gracilibacteria bacterium]